MAPPASVTLMTFPFASVVLVEVMPSFTVVTLVPLYDHVEVFPDASVSDTGRLYSSYA